MTSNFDDQGNFASLILRHGADRADRTAIVVPKVTTDEAVTDEEAVTYGEFIERIQSIRAGLAAEGFVVGDRVVVLIPVSIDLYAVVLALIASGLTAVLIDTGMGAKRIK